MASLTETSLRTDDPPSGAARRAARRRRAVGVAVSAGAHLGILAIVLAFRPEAQMVVEPEIPIPVALIDFPGPPDPPGPPSPEKKPPGPPKPEPPAPAKPAPPVKAIARPTPKPPPKTVETIAAKETPAPPLPQLSEMQVAGAMTADSAGAGGGGGGGGGGGECNMLRKLQAALRRDALVQAEVGEAHRVAGSRRPLWVWNGHWIRSPGQAGDGLAALRQAIMWEVAFAPEACQRERMRGLALISLNDGPGASRVAVGAGEWRWADLLASRRPIGR